MSRLALPSRSMGHFDLAKAKFCGDRHRFHERVKGPNGNKGPNDLAAKCLQRAARVAQTVAKKFRANAVGQFRHGKAEPHVLSACTDELSSSPGPEKAEDRRAIKATMQNAPNVA